MSTRFLRQPVWIGLICLLLITAAVASSFLPLVNSAVGGSTDFVFQTPTDNIFRISIVTNDIIYNPQDQLIYVTRPSAAGSNGNSITRINPLTGDEIGSVYVGSEPNKLALSDNGQDLYVSLKGAFSIRRYNTVTQTPGIQFSAGHRGYSDASNAIVQPSDMAVAPGNPNLLTITTEYPDRRVVAFNNGVELPNKGSGADFLAFSNSSTLFGSGGYQTGLLKFAVSDTGIADVTGNPSSFWAYKLKFQNGLLFDAAGRIIDANTRALLGTCIPFPPAHPAVTNTYPFVPDTATGRVLYAVKENSADITIKVFDVNTYLQIGSITVPNVGYETVPTELLRYGTNGLAMRTSDNQIYFIQTSLIPTENPLPTPTGSPTTPTPTPTPHARFIRDLTLPNRDLLYRNADRKFYATVPTVSGNQYSNSLTRIEPSTGAIENSVVVGSQPGRLAFSEDEQVLYIGINGENAVRKFDMQTQTPGLQFPLGSGNNGPRTAYDMEVLPGDPSAVVVSYGASNSSFNGTDLYDNGVKRGQTVDPSGTITPGASQTLYIGEGYLYKLGISSSGLTFLNETFLTSGNGESIIVGNMLYGAGGGVLDLNTKDFVGSYSGVGSWAGLTIDVPNNRIFYISNDSGGAPLGVTIRAYRLDNFLPIGSIPLPGVHVSHQYGETPRRFFRWGENGLAFTDYQNKIYFVQSDLVSSNGSVPTALQLSSQVFSASETAGTLPVTVARSGGTTGISTIDYATVDGTATAGADYTATSGKLTFSPGESSKTINIPILNDTVFEGSETFSIVLSNPGGDGQVELFEPSSAVLTISDNDGQPTISAANVSVSEPLAGMTSAAFTVKLSNPTTQTVTVNYSTSNGSATADSDYVPTNGTLTFAPLETSKTIEVQVLADQVTESNETFRINFASAVNAVISTFQVTGTIVNFNPNPTPTPTVTPTPTPTPTPAPVFVRRVNLPINDLVYSPSAGSIYASVLSSAGTERGNTITKIDPTNGAIGNSVFVGSEPNRLAMSDDGQTIYVKLDGAKSIRRFDVATQSAGLQFSPPGPFIVFYDWAVQPGNPDVLAIAGGTGGVAIFDNGVRRPDFGTGGANAINSIAFAEPTTLYGYDDQSSPYELVRFTLAGSGVTGNIIGNGLVAGSGIKIKYSNGFIYATSGRVVSLATRTVVGTFPGAGGLMSIDQGSGRIFFITGGTLTAFDINNFAKIGTATIPGVTGLTGELVRWGENGLAVRANNELLLIQSPLISPYAILPTGIQVGSQTIGTSENSNSLQATVTRNGDLSGTSTVDYATVSGTATAGADFAPITGTIVFAPGETSKAVTVPLISDNIFEETESFSFVLSNPGGVGSVQLLSPDKTTINISDNDPMPTVSTPNITAIEPSVTAGTSTALFVVQLSNPTTRTVSVNYSTVDGSATAGIDYVSTSGTLTFAPLQTIKTIAVQILPDRVPVEPNETFKIEFSSSNVFVNNSLGTANIINYFPRSVLHGRFDFDGDRRSDISVFRTIDNTWYLAGSSGGFAGMNFGETGDKLTPADFDGDGRADIAVWRPSNGNWYILNSLDGSFRTITWGVEGDIPVPGNFDGDNKADIAVFRPSDGTWYRILSKDSAYSFVNFGIDGDLPQIGDYDGDGSDDLTVYRPSTGIWYTLGTLGAFSSVNWGIDGDIAMSGDYDGDGVADPAVFRPSTGEWFVYKSNGGFASVSWGETGDLPAAADYDGDGKTDFAIYRPSTGTWWINGTTAGIYSQHFGEDGDRPIPASFVN